MTDKPNTEEKASHCRLPKVFNPDNYIINLIMDFENLKYKIFNQMDLSVTPNKSDVGNGILILNSVEKYKIKKIFCLDEKRNSELFNTDLFDNKNNIPDENACLFFHSKDLNDIVNHFIFKFEGNVKYSKMLEENVNESYARENIKNSFIEFLEDNCYSCDNFKNNFTRIFSLKSDIFDFFDYLLKKAEEVINSSYKINKVNYDNAIKEEAIYIKLPRDYAVGENIKVLLEIEGDVRTQRSPTGFYLSIWGSDSIIMDIVDEQKIKQEWRKKIEHNKEIILLNSVFCMAGEPVEFRNVFPCFDEPCFKSKFSMNVLIENEDILSSYADKFHVLSNGELMNKTEYLFDEKNYIKFTFSESPLMSIYLLTWIIGYYDYISKDILIENTESDDALENCHKFLSEKKQNNSYSIKIRSFYPLHRSNESETSLELAEKSLQFYSSYFKIPYTFPKLDLVPAADFSFRALECWGCILFIHYALLVGPKVNILERKLASRTTIHEISHMWFGNLVTMEWWDDIWLNEGFARFMEFECLNRIKPELNLEDNFIQLIFSQALQIDENSNTHPVIGECSSPEHLHDIFDTISYAKGASILRMFNNFIGSEKFMKVIQEYLKFYKFKNTKTVDLWQMFSKHANIDLVEIMHSWTMLSGHPAIFARLSYDEQSFILTQYPFPKNFNASDDSNEKMLWQIPLFIKTKKSEFRFLMTEKTLKLKLKDDLMITDIEEIIEGKDFIKINNGMKGFYRVYYINNDNESFSDHYLNFLNGLKNEDVIGENHINLYDTFDVVKKENAGKNPLLKAILSNFESVTPIDIAGLLEDYLASKDYSTCLFILKSLNSLKEKDSIILYYANKIHTKIKKIFEPYFSFLGDFDEKKSCESNLKDIIGENHPVLISDIIEENYSQFFGIYHSTNEIIYNLINNNDLFLILKNKIFKNIYEDKNNQNLINHEIKKAVENEYSDEFYEYMLNAIMNTYNHAKANHSDSVDNCKSIITHVLNNFSSERNFINKNLKFSIYNLVNKFSFLLTEDSNYSPDHKEKDADSLIIKCTKESIYEDLLKEYATNFYNFSLREKKSFINVLCKLENSDLYRYFTLVDFMFSNQPLFRSINKKDVYSILDMQNPESLKIVIEYKISLFFLYFINKNTDGMEINNQNFTNNVKLFKGCPKKFDSSLFIDYYKNNKENLLKAILTMCLNVGTCDSNLIEKVIEYSQIKFSEIYQKLISFEMSEEDSENVDFSTDIRNHFENYLSNNIFNYRKNRKLIFYFLLLLKNN